MSTPIRRGSSFVVTLPKNSVEQLRQRIEAVQMKYSKRVEIDREAMLNVDMSDFHAAMRAAYAQAMIKVVMQGLNGGTPISPAPQLRAKQELLPRDGGPQPIEKQIAHPFAVGDIVTHGLGGVFRVCGINCAGDSIDVECLEAPRCDFAWCEVGDRESNLSRRYTLLRPAAP